MQLGHTEIFVADPLASRDFYESVLGFEVTAVQQGQFIWLSRDGREFLLRPGRQCPPADEYRKAGMAMVLYCDDLNQAVRDLQQRGVTFRGNDGTPECPTFTDPDGNWFQLVDPQSH